MPVVAEAKRALIHHLCLSNCSRMSLTTYHQLVRKTYSQLKHDLQQSQNSHQYHVILAELKILDK